MNALTSPDLAHLLIRADSTAIGICVITNNVQLLRNKLYAERKRLGLTNLTFVQPPVDSESRLWIIKKDAKANGAAQD